ncbi:MAG: energy-coupling factor ABC transporter permease [Candidatus Thermoplasmatota archaeon]|nr:energy-coupling factor ABC transporter permease [Euryarchaeota archaeon]MBU4031182.1 energy-coupling factor ABC transporter permease [Candidatus Thermoplasmatota archaeon]MBU4071308.1 energy-coupling factor ABC transporter permease [Candidatus Thermoplasmatota archaeon]MBU4143397.1 energy-coupling factor ABC transporter permease [Candidatus Thermoplasmatota archaeon]MBU4592212.1 energy-coupling factor ABC transporter permease [Candidatus Thermoplasmatota archaeon]
MHIPDGLMAPAVAAFGWIIAIGFLALTMKVLNKKINDRQITLMAVLSAGIFVAQMLNFPIGGGTTGHLIGAALATVILGPFAGILIITVILIIQALVFGDGGLTALGLNILNMAVIGCLVAWYVYRALRRANEKAAVFAAAFASVFVAALAAAVELAVSHSISGGTYGIAGSIAFPAMTIYHLFIGIGEAIITSGVVLYIARVSPGMLRMPKLTFLNRPKEVVPDA